MSEATDKIREFQEQYGDPFAGGVNIVETQQSTHYEKDPETGEKRKVKVDRILDIVDNQPYGTLGTWKEEQTGFKDDGTRVEVYQNPDNKQWYRDKWDAYMSESYLKNAFQMDDKGNLTFNLPEEILNSKAFKDNYYNDTALSKIRESIYNYGDEYKFTDPQDSSKTITAKEYADRYSEGIIDLFKRGYDLHKYSESLKSDGRAGDAIDELDFDQLSMVYDADSSREGYNGYIYVPKSFVEGNPNNKLAAAIRDSGKWNEETGYIKQSDFDEVYTLDNVDKNDVLVAMGQAKAKLRQDLRDPDLEAGEKADPEMKKEYLDDYARSLAFLRYLEAKDPSGNFWQEAGLNAGAAADGFVQHWTRAFFALDSFFDAFGPIGTIVETAGEVASGPIGWAMLGSTRGSELATGKSAQQLVDELTVAEDYYSERIGAVSDTAKGVSIIGGLIGDLAADVAMSAAAGHALGNVAKASQALAGGTAYTAGLAGSAADKAYKLYKLTDVETQAIVKAMDFTLKVLPDRAAVGLVDKAIGIQKFLANSKNAEKAASIAGKTVGFLADTVMDAVISDPQNVRKVITGSYDSGETVDYVMQQIAMNAAGMFVFESGEKVLRYSGKLWNGTKLGREANARVSQWINKYSAKLGDTGEALKKWVNNGEDQVDKLNRLSREAAEKAELGGRSAGRLGRKSEALKNQAYVLQQRRALRSTQKAFGGMNISEVGLEKAEQAQNVIRGMSNSIDNYQRSISFQVATYVNKDINPTIAGAHESIDSLRQQIVSLERKAGSGVTPPKTSAGDTITTVLSQESTNYMAAKTYIEDIDRAIARGSAPNATVLDQEAAAVAKKVRPTYESAISYYDETMSPELRAKLDELRPHYKEFYSGINSYRYNWGANGVGIMNVSQRAAYEANPDDYMRLQFKEVAESDWKMVRKDGMVKNKNVTDIQHQTFRDFTDFVDPEITRWEYMLETAQVERAATFAGNYFDMPGANRTTVVSGEETARAYAMEQGRKQAQAAVKDYSAHIGDSESSDLKIQFKQKTDAGTPEAKVAQVATSPSEKMSKTDLRAAQDTVIDGLTGPDIVEVLEKEGVPSGSFFTEIDELTDGAAPEEAERIYQAWKAEFPERTQQYLDHMVAENGVSKPEPVARAKKANKDKTAVEKAEDALYGRTSYDDFIKDQREAMWKSFKDSNRGTETTYVRDEYDQIARRETVSHNGALYRELYSVGGKPTKYQFNEAFDDVLENGQDSRYYWMFREFDANPDVETIGKNLTTPSSVDFPDYNTGNADIDDILLVKESTNGGLAPLVEPAEPGAEWLAFQQARQNLGSSFEDKFSRSYLRESGFRDSDTMTELVDSVAKGDKAYAEYVVYDPAAKRLDGISEEFDAEKTLEGFGESFDKQIDTTITSVGEEGDFKIAIEKMAEQSPGASVDDIQTYAVLSEMRRKANLDKAHESIDKAIDKELKGKGLDTDQANKIKSEAHNIYDEAVESKFDDARLRLNDTGSPVVDHDEWYGEIDELRAKIEGADKAANTAGNNTIMLMDEEGRVSYVEVDPAIADLYKYRPGITTDDMSVVARFNYALTQTFRMGTTGINLKSFINQGFRDTGNALVIGGAFGTIKSCSKYFAKTFGDDVADALNAFEMKQVREIANREGIDLAEAYAKREMAIGSALSPASTEAALYSKARREAYALKNGQSLSEANGILAKSKQVAGEIYDKLDHMMNGAREEHLRKRVYANSLNEAMGKGYTIKEARQYAQFAMNNATTNFGRSLYHLDNFAKSVPYFRSAINGTKSFWRMFSMDPLAISSRIMGGIVLPTMYLVGQSLADPQNRQVYLNLPEYKKTDRIPFVINGQYFDIPIPQELSAIVDPIRHFVEYLDGAQNNTFWELMLNDALAFSPVDLQGFALLDSNVMLNDPTIFDRLENGVSQMFSQMAPIPVKSIYMAATERDPFTGQKLRDKTKRWYDEESGQWVIQSNTQSELSNKLAEWFPNLPVVGNGAMFQKIASGVFGQTGMDVLDSIVAAFDGKGFVVDTLIEKQGRNAAKAVSSATYEKENSDWYDAVKILQDEKEAIIHDPRVVEINNKLANETDESKRQKLLAQRKDITDPYTERVSQMVTNLKQKYGGELDRFRYASVIQLLNFGTDSGWYQGSAYAKQANNKPQLVGWKEATNTAYNLGIKGPEDLSVFGYLKQDYDTGEVGIKYTTPTGILDMRNSIWTRNSVNQSSVQAALESKEFLGDETIGQKMQTEFWDRYNKLKSNDYDGKNKLAKEWNKKVLQAITPELTKLTVEDVVNNADLLNYLEKYIRVPSEYQKVKGRYVSSGYDAKTGTTQLDKNAAFFKNYMRSYMKKLKGEK